MTAILVRPAALPDIPAITAIYDHAVLRGTGSFEVAPPGTAEMERRYQTLCAGGYPFLVAEQDGAVAGYAYAGPYHPRKAFRFTVEDSIYVVPQAHRRGIGRALLERLIVESTAAGFRQMIAVIGDPAQSASIALHARCGFHGIGTLESVGFKFDRWLDIVLMQRGLGMGATTTPE